MAHQHTGKQALFSRLIRSIGASNNVVPAMLVGFLVASMSSFWWGVIPALALWMILNRISDLEDEIRDK